MIKELSNFWQKALILMGFALALTVYSAFHAYKISDETIRNNIPPPFYNIRFVLHPNRHIDDVPELGFKLGWVVTYAPRSKNYGTSFFVSLCGSMLASGTPSIVAKQQQRAQGNIESFRRAFAQADAAIQVGMSITNVAAILKTEPMIFTNADGSIDAFYTFTPRALAHASVDWLTNGFELSLSNGIIIRKNYSYTSSR